MQNKRSSRIFVALTGVLGFAILGAGADFAADGNRVVSVTINSGENYVIKDLSPTATPAVHVVDNPDALVVHSDAPGQLALHGAAVGEWSIDVTTAAGEAVTYKVDVNAASAKATPPAAPSELSSAGSASASSASSASDGATPVAPAAGAAGLTAAAVSASAPASSATAPTSAAASSSPAESTAATTAASASAPAPTTLAENATGTALPPVPSTPPSASPAAEPPAAASPAAAPPAAAASAPASAPAPATESAAPMMPNQANAPEELPTEKFRSNPMTAGVSPSEGGASGTNFLPDDVVLLASGTSRIYDFPSRIRRISVADTGVADVQVINPYQINLIGHQTGFTTLAIWDAQGRYQERQVRVDPHGKQQVMLNVIVAELNRTRLEQTGFNWTAALPKIEVSMVGLNPGPATPFTASSSLTAQTIVNSAGAQQIISNTATGTLPPGGVIIPLLLSPTMNYGITAQNSNFQTQDFWNYLENHNLAKILAEPHLLANSGEKAEFLSGGEIPIVLAQALNTSIVFKQFGTSVIFVPTVVGKNDIELQVKPEVSEPDFAHGVNLFGFTVPAFVTRRAETDVRLRNNQTLIIAGLILHTKTSEVDKTPYLGDVPYLGTLFKRTSYQDTESDLVMSVTPQMVEPLPPNGVVALPTDRGPMTQQEIRTERLPQPDASRPRF